MAQISRLLIAALSACLFAGCATAPPPMRVTGRTSATMLARDIRDHQSVDGSSPLSAFQAALSPPTRSAAFVEEKLVWCADTKDRGSASFMVTVRFLELCAARMGTFEDNACFLPASTERVLFLAKVSAEGTCKEGNPQVELQVIEPLVSSLDPAYLRRLAQAGYPTPKEAQARQVRQQQYRSTEDALVNKLVAAEMGRVESERPLISKRGATVCRVEGANTFKGFVEDATEDKIKISVAFAYATSVPSMQVGGFQPHTIWDIPGHWRLC